MAAKGIRNKLKSQGRSEVANRNLLPSPMEISCDSELANDKGWLFLQPEQCTLFLGQCIPYALDNIPPHHLTQFDLPRVPKTIGETPMAATRTVALPAPNKKTGADLYPRRS